MKDLLEKYSGHLTVPCKPSPLITDDPATSIQEQVYEKILNNILTGIYEPDQRLQPSELASAMAVTQTQIREALRELKSEGLVCFQAAKGFSVARFTMDDLREIYFLRSMLEGIASELAAKNLTDKQLDDLELLCNKMDECLEEGNFDDLPKYNTIFHGTIYQAAKSPRLYTMIMKLWNGFLRSSLSALTLRASETVEEHKAIYQALRNRNPEEARLKTQDHIVSVLEDLSEYWRDWLTPVED